MLTPSPKKLVVSVSIALLALLATAVILGVIVGRCTKPSPAESLKTTEK